MSKHRIGLVVVGAGIATLWQLLRDDPKCGPDCQRVAAQIGQFGVEEILKGVFA